MTYRDAMSRRRPGFVLITVVIVGALLFMSAAMFISQLTTEAHITKTDAYFKSALNLAETGLSDTMTTIQNGTGAQKTQWAIWFQEDHGHIGAAVPGTGVHGTYQVTATIVGAPTPLGGNQYRGELQLTSVGTVYPPSIASMIGSTAYVARRAIRSRTIATWTYIAPYDDPGIPVVVDPVVSPVTIPIRYGVFTGADLTIKGASKEIKGDVFANGNIFIQKASGLQSFGSPPQGGNAYAVGTVTGGIPASVQHAGQAEIVFPVIDTALMRTMYDAYVTGKYPFNGGNPDYPDTRTTTADGLANRVAYHIDDLLAASTTWIDPLNSLHQLKVLPGGSISASVSAAMMNPKGFYFFDGAVDLPKNSAAAWSGTIVVNGNFDIHSNITVGSSGQLMNLLVTGNITKDNGCSTINGVVYTNGTFSGNGTAALNGALLAKGSVYMNGTLDITYVPNLPAIMTGGTVIQEGSTTPGTPTHYPAVYALGDTPLTKPDAGSALWQEVTILN
ncbi:MAG: hypothetical protein ACYDHF_03740 [Candidatus Cryosericum sp.]